MLIKNGVITGAGIMDQRYTITFDGIEYLLGSALSLILCCPKCGEEHFRPEWNYFPPLGKPENHQCFTCKSQMEPIRIDELETRWKPLWRKIEKESIMKKNTKGKIQNMTDGQLIKRYNSLKSKLSSKADGISVQMKYLKFHIRKRGLKI